MRASLSRAIFGILRSIARVYVLVLVVAWLFSEKLIFLPHPASYRDGPEIVKLTTRSGARIAAVFLPQAHPSLTILFSHGNGEDLGDVRPAVEHLHAVGFAVLAYDYEGYGTSDGSPSETATYADIDAAYDYLVGTLHVAPETIIAYGRSLGGGPSVDLASRRPLGGPRSRVRSYRRSGS